MNPGHPYLRELQQFRTIVSVTWGQRPKMYLYYVTSVNESYIMSIDPFRHNRHVNTESSFFQKYFLTFWKSCTVSPLYFWCDKLHRLIHGFKVNFASQEYNPISRKTFIFIYRWLHFYKRILYLFSWEILVFSFLL